MVRILNNKMSNGWKGGNRKSLGAEGCSTNSKTPPCKGTAMIEDLSPNNENIFRNTDQAKKTM